MYLLTFHIGKETSFQYLALELDMGCATVDRYLDLLEKSFVLVNVRGFSRNLRKEITKTSRYYFYDTGVRNAVIENFNPLTIRSGDDVGMLWENFVVIERLKRCAYQNIPANRYFWRTWEGQEIDLIEERGGLLAGYEIKYKKDTAKIPSQWATAYPDASFVVITRKNFVPFIT